MSHTSLLAFALLFMAACSTTPDGDHAPAAGGDAWSEHFVPSRSLETDGLSLEPLGPEHAQLDYDAFMSSREHLHETMGWGSWPRADMTVDENRGDLERHAKEFVDREGYAYTVLTPDGSACRGCIYLNPVEDEPRSISLAYWVTADGVTTGLDEELLVAVVEWLESDWPVDRVVQSLHEGNARGAALAAEGGFVEGEKTDARTEWTLELR